MAKQAGAAKKGVAHGDSSCGSSWEQPALLLPSSHTHAKPCSPGLSTQHHSFLLLHAGQEQPISAQAKTQHAGTDEPALPCALPLPCSVEVPSLFADGSHQELFLAGPGTYCTALCSARQGRGWLLVGAGTVLFLPKAQGPRAATSCKWPREGEAEEKQR